MYSSRLADAHLTRPAPHPLKTRPDVDGAEQPWTAKPTQGRVVRREREEGDEVEGEARNEVVREAVGQVVLTDLHRVRDSNAAIKRSSELEVCGPFFATHCCSPPVVDICRVELDEHVEV